MARIGIFKGREARLNNAIIQILAQTSPLTIYQIYLWVRRRKSFHYTKYSVVNRRVRALEDEGFIESVGLTRNRAGFLVKLYQLTMRAYLAFLLNRINLNRFVELADEADIITALAALLRLK